MTFTVDELASLLTDAHMSGWRDGHMLCPTPDVDALFMDYSDDVARLCTDHVEH